MVRKFAVYSKVPVQQCWDRTGKGRIGVAWAIVNKGDLENPEIRARLCAQEFKYKDPGKEDVFAPMPPTEAARSVLSFTMTADNPQEGQERSRLRVCGSGNLGCATASSSL